MILASVIGCCCCQQMQQKLSDNDIYSAAAGWKRENHRRLHLGKHFPTVSLDTLQVCPDFSLRLLDETYAAENGTIAQIQAVMVDYFKARTGVLQTCIIKHK